MRCFIRTVPWVKERYEWARELADRLPNAELIVSEGESGLETLLRALEAQGSGSAWHFEDDVILTSDWAAKARYQQWLAPRAIIQGYDGLLYARAEGKAVSAPLSLSGWSCDLLPPHHDSSPRAFMGLQCFYVPSGFAPRIVAHGREWTPPPNDRWLAYDEGWRAADGDREAQRAWYARNTWDHVIRSYLQRIGRPFWVTVPSLVQHRECPSSLTVQRKWRCSPTFVP